MPADIASFSERGMALMMYSRTGSTLRIRNSTPDRNTAPSAVSQAYPMPRTTPYVKYAFSPMPGARAMG